MKPSSGRSGRHALDGTFWVPLAQALWVRAFLGEFGEVRRIHFKSLGGILALQEKISGAWTAGRPEAVPSAAPAG